MASIGPSTITGAARRRAGLEELRIAARLVERHRVAVAKQEGPQRIVMLSTFAVARDRLKAASKLPTGMAMGPQIKDKTAGEEALRPSSLDWTIVYPTKLTNGPKTEPRVATETTKVGVLHKISRADVASFLLQAATDGLYSRRAVIITG
jgi:hypothetical protein